MKRFHTVFSFLLFTVLLSGQYDPKENFYDAEFFFAEEDYAEALYAFTKVYMDGYQDNANINYRIGICLLEIDGRKNEAIPYLETAVKNITDRYREGRFNEEEAPPDAHLYLGNAYRIDEQFEKACENYRKFLEYSDEDALLALKGTDKALNTFNDIAEVAGTDDPQTLYTIAQIQSCENARSAVQEKAAYDVGTLGQINEIRAPVYNPAVSGDLGTIAFMGRQKFYNGIYISRAENGKWSKPYNITPSIQSDGNQTVLSLSHDGNQLLLTRADQFESEIYLTEYRNNRWYKSQPLDKPVNSKYYESHACFTPDGNTIYFTSNRKESQGGMDIFKCDRLADGSWGELQLLGDHVNTGLNEENPFVSPDGNRLYFSSQGHPGIGGFDIFYVEIKDDGSYSAPRRLDYPLNTTDDDFAFTPKGLDFDNALALYAKGESDQVDLFRLEWIPEGAQPVSVAFETEVPGEEGVIGEMAENVDEVVEEVVEETVEETVEEVTEDVVEEVVESTEEAMEEAAETYMIRPVFFDFDSYRLTPAAREKLDGLASLMERFPTLKLEVTGHTDALGSDTYNNNLARLRAKSVADYLVSEGVERSRLNVNSRGETSPVAMNNTGDNRDAPRGRALNRRVHFNASVPSGILIEIEKIKVPDNLKIR